MLKKVKLKKYRCFEDSEISFRDISIIVGHNNAGKSTMIEALRIISVVSSRFKHAIYSPAPQELKFPAKTKGLQVNIDHLKIDRRSIVYQYKEDEGAVAEIVAIFDENISIHVYLSSEIFFSTIDVDKHQIRSKAEALRAPDIGLFIMPQIGLIREDEQLLSTDTVKNHMSTRLASRHFRNELLLYPEYFEEFRNIAQITWPGLRITDLLYLREEDKIQLLVYDSNYAAEIGLMGSGLQMWLQMVWFISRCPSTCTIVLDEPDVYMHPDLQRKILKIVRQKFQQIIIATHSVEIISAVEPNQIVTIDKSSRKMRYADSYTAVQNLVNNLGSDHNLSLVRLGGARKCIFVEGKDIKILSKFHEILYPQSNESLDQLPTVSLVGWSSFNEALGAARLFYEETHGEIKTICILDRDYHSQDEIDQLLKKAEENHLHLHIWKKKELENYILTPQSIFKVTGCPFEEYQKFEHELFNEIDKLKEQTLGCFLDQFNHASPNKSPSTNLKQASTELEKKWQTLEDRLSVCNGKDLISLINAWIRHRYHQSSSRAKLLSAVTPNDISEEVKGVIAALINK